MSEFVFHPQEEAFPFGETVQALKERAADFAGHLVARLGLNDSGDAVVDVSYDIAATNVDAEEAHIVYAEEEKKEEKPPQRPERRPRDPPPTGHNPETCRMVVCTACNRLGHPK
jgi:hypothetical protein